MKRLKLIFAVSFLSIIIFLTGCKNNDNSVAPEPKSQVKIGTTASPKAQFGLKKQMNRLQKAGINTAELDAFFSLGWTSYPVYDSAAVSNEIYSFGYAGAFNNTNYRNLDMGDVAVSYGLEKTKFFKYEYDYTYQDEEGNEVTEKDIFYDLYNFPMTEEEIMNDDFSVEEVKIPYLGGQDYNFTATGSSEFSSVSISVAAPAEQLKITEPKSGAEVDLGQTLTVKWQGGQGTNKLFLSVYPMLDWENISDDDWETIFEQFEFEFGFFKEIDAGTGEYTLTTEEMKSISNNKYVNGLFIDVYNYNVVENNDSGRNVVAEIHLGNSVEASIKK